MNGLAHYLVGLVLTLLVIQKMSRDGDDVKFTPQIIVIVFVITYFSHIFVDAFAHFTYHPSNSDWSNMIYAGWHLLTYIAEAVGAIYFLRTDIRYVWSMIGAVGFDLWDWSLRRGLELEFLPPVHWMADGAQQILFEWWMPSLRNIQWALLVEVVFVYILLIYWRKLHHISKLAENPRPASIRELLVLIVIFGFLRLLTLV